ncbi:von Willebrand factor A domain-containing protein 3A isoform X7 [Parus major]|uniref:von Willebrand factor A domain-containing protein 3A isoform X7 n=1 Tax=Parus major TaxID=9157 RepID=UPI0007712259|nr:von Willebrand factor A domain-containing protein 3A isoform X7 [Parus major]
MAWLLDNDQYLEKIGLTKFHRQGDDPPQQDSAVPQLGPDNGLLGAHSSKTQDVLRGQMKKTQSQKVQTTEEWIRNYSLESLQLTLEYLCSRNSGNSGEEMVFTEETVTDFECRLAEVIELYQHRIQWLLQDSRKVFGVIKGSKVGLLVDVSHLSYGPRLLDFQKNLLCLIDEQLCYKKQLYCLSFSTEISLLWESPKIINVHVLHEARQWIQELEPGRGCNLLKALRHVLPMKELNSLVLIVGSCPDQSFEILCDYAQQCTLGRKVQIHIVTYDCNPASLAVLKNLAEAVRGRYHCYSSKGENFDSSDFHLLLQESQKAKDLLKSIKQAFQRRVGGLLGSKKADVSTEFANTAPSSFFPKPPNDKGPLVIQTPGILAKTSADWLKTYGLKAKKLDLYQVLAPNAFSPVENFIPVLKKTVSSTLHEKVMIQFEWYDGTVKNIHVDLPVLYSYQKILAKMVRIYEKRIDWLSGASRRIWGSVCERRVVILVDISATNSTYITLIQQSLRLLLEEQMSNKDYFNIIAFGSDIVPWQQELCPSQPENLEKAWRWVLSLECKGSRNFMSALRRAVEVDFKDKDKHKSQGLYLLTTGIPDQETHTISAYVAEACGGFDFQLHVCLFSVAKGTDSSGIIPARYANPRETACAFKEIVQAASGRFHWFGEAGIFESDDISSIISEMEKAKNYSQKCAFLVESLKQRSVNQSVKPITPEGDSNVFMRSEKKKTQKVPSPKPTAVLKDVKDNHGAERNTPVRVLAWRPPSTKAGIPPAQTVKEQPQTENKGKHKPRKQPELSVSVFYTEEGRNVGTIYQKYPKAVCIRKSVCSVTLPEDEEICSSKEWLTKYSIKKLKLELPRLMFGPGCTHQKKTVQSLHKKVSAKYCSIFPSAEINGVVKHLQFHPKELETYTEQLEKVLQRYIQRVQWLLSGSRRLFGTILEANVCVLMDTSGSMGPYLPHVMKELTSLIWEQLRKNEVRGAVEFLKKLASQTGGRFHCSSGGEDGQLAAHRILTEGLDDEDNPVFPYFEGDDLKKLTQEVAKARSFLKQAKSWRLLLEKWNTNQKDDSGFQKSVQCAHIFQLQAERKKVFFFVVTTVGKTRSCRC